MSWVTLLSLGETRVDRTFVAHTGQELPHLLCGLLRQWTCGRLAGCYDQKTRLPALPLPGNALGGRRLGDRRVCGDDQLDGQFQEAAAEPANSIGYLFKCAAGRPPQRQLQVSGVRLEGTPLGGLSGTVASFTRASGLSSLTWRGSPGASCPSTTSNARQSNGSRRGEIKWTRLSCRPIPANAVRPQLHAHSYDLGNFNTS
jgi:hypothetical protein